MVQDHGNITPILEQKTESQPEIGLRDPRLICAGGGGGWGADPYNISVKSL